MLPFLLDNFDFSNLELVIVSDNARTHCPPPPPPSQASSPKTSSTTSNNRRPHRRMSPPMIMRQNMSTSNGGGGSGSGDSSTIIKQDSIPHKPVHHVVEEDTDTDNDDIPTKEQQPLVVIESEVNSPSVENDRPESSQADAATTCSNTNASFCRWDSCSSFYPDTEKYLSMPQRSWNPLLESAHHKAKQHRRSSSPSSTAQRQRLPPSQPRRKRTALEIIDLALNEAASSPMTASVAAATTEVVC